MKFRLPLGLLTAITAAMATCAIAESNILTEDTIISGQSSAIMDTSSDSLSYTSASSSDKKDLTITGATTQLYYLGQDKNLSFEGLDTLSLKDNQAVTDESGLIRGNKNGNGTISISGNNSVLIDNNDTVSTGSNMYGGVLRSYLVDLKIDNNTKIDITGNNYSSTFSNGTKTQSNTYGGAIYFTGGSTFSMSNNGDINISGNSITPVITQTDYGPRGATAHGGAIDIGTASTVVWDKNSSLTISNNLASGYQARGGALHAKSQISISNTTGTISFSGNKATSEYSTALGGAISLEGSGSVLFQDNDIVEFNNNEASGKAYSYNDPAAGGGAIHGINGTSYLFTNNGEVNFTGNIASNPSGKAVGGAIYATSTGSNVLIANNTKVTFSNNGVVATSGSYAYGGAIYSRGGVNLRNNDSVLFEKNFEKTGNTYRLRSIHAKSYSSSDKAVDLSLSAADKGNITIKDSITVSGNLNLNENYEDKTQNGTIIFTAASTEDDLNAIIAANTAEGEQVRTATADEIEASRTSNISGTVTLNAGTLSLQDGAIFKATELIIATGATLEIKTTARDNEVLFLFGDAEGDSLLETTLDANLYMADNSVLKLAGTTLNMNGNNVVMGDNVNIIVSDDMVEDDESITLFSGVNNILDENGEAITTITVNGVATEYSVEGDNIVISGMPVPEPATTTMSLLALAALAARRRRK